MKGTKSEYIVTVDLGTTNVKTGVFDGELREIGVSTAPVAYRREGSFVEFDPEAYWRSCAAQVREVVVRTGTDPRRVRALSLTSQAESLVLLDGRSKPLRMGISWMDQRSESECESLKGTLDPSRGYEVTGLPDIVTTWPITKILWLRRHERDVYDRVRKYLLVKDYILHRLTGGFFGEHTVYNFSYYFDISRKRFWEEPLDIAGVREEQLPELVGPGESVGTLLGESAEELGLPGAVEVNTGALDHFAGMIGCGNIRERQVSETTGTVLAIATPVPKPMTGSHRLPCHCGALEGGYVLLPVCESGGSSLEWYKENFYPGESFARINADVEGLGAAESEVIFLPYVTGTNSPEFDQSARGVFYGLRVRHGRADLARAVMEGVTFLLRKNLELLETLSGAVDSIISLGGGSKSKVWNRMKADVTGKRILVPAGSESPSLGAAILAAVRLGLYGGIEEAVGRGVRAGETYEPARGRRYEENYAKFLEIYRRLEPVFHAG